MMATTATTNHAIAATTPMMTLNRTHAAIARTIAARTRAPNDGPDFSVFSMNQMYSRVGGSYAPSVVGAAQVLVAPAAGLTAVELKPRQAVAADLPGVRIARRDRVATLDEQDAGGGCDGGGAHGTKWSRAAALRPIARWSEIAAHRVACLSIRLAAAAPASRAGRIADVKRRRTRQRAPLKARLATVANPRSSERSASSRWAMRSPLGRSGSLTPTQ